MAASAENSSFVPMLLLAALGARAAARPVKVALQRPLMPNNTTHRPATIQRIRIGTDRREKVAQKLTGKIVIYEEPAA